MAVASFFDDAEIVELNEEKLVVYSPSPFRKDVILNRYTELIKEAMRDQFQTEIELVVLDEDEFPQYSRNRTRRNFSEFNSQFTFDTFVVGSSNQPLHKGVERYLSPVSGRRATIHLPSYSLLLAIEHATCIAAPDVIPHNNPS